MARKCHFTIAAIDNALSTSNFEVMCKLANVKDHDQLIGEHLDQDLVMVTLQMNPFSLVKA